MSNPKYCHECGQEFFIDAVGVAHHSDENRDTDAHHTPFSLESEDE